MIDVLPGFKGLDAGSANHSRILELLGPKWLQVRKNGKRKYALVCGIEVLDS